MNRAEDAMLSRLTRPGAPKPKRVDRVHPLIAELDVIHARALREAGPGALFHWHTERQRQTWDARPASKPKTPALLAAEALFKGHEEPSR